MEFFGERNPTYIDEMCQLHCHTLGKNSSALSLKVVRSKFNMCQTTSVWTGHTLGLIYVHVLSMSLIRLKIHIYILINVGLATAGLHQFNPTSYLPFVAVVASEAIGANKVAVWYAVYFSLECTKDFELYRTVREKHVQLDVGGDFTLHASNFIRV